MKPTMIPPITPLDGFFTASANVRALIDEVTYIDTINAIQTAKTINPETTLVGETYAYVDPTNQTNLIPTNWTLLIYGPAGNNIDAIQNALINYILANSTHTQAQWTQILPSLFKQTEFTLVPMWDQYAVPNRNQQSGVYSPLANASRALSMMTSVAQSRDLSDRVTIQNFADVVQSVERLKLLTLLTTADIKGVVVAVADAAARLEGAALIEAAVETGHLVTRPQQHRDHHGSDVAQMPCHHYTHGSPCSLHNDLPSVEGFRESVRRAAFRAPQPRKTHEGLRVEPVL